MSRFLLLLLIFCAGVQFAPAQSFPKFPQQAHVTTAEHVKNYWTRTLRWQSRSTRNRSAWASKQQLIKQIEAGQFDDYAELVAQRGNLVYLEFHNRMIGAQKTKEKIALLEQSLFAPEPAPLPAAVAVRPAPQPAQPGVHALTVEEEYPDPEIVYEDEEDCPQPSRRAYRPRAEEICITPTQLSPRPLVHRPGVPQSRPQLSPREHRPNRPSFTPRPRSQPSSPAHFSKPSPQVSKPRFVPTPASRPSPPSPTSRPTPISRPSPPPSRPQPSPVAPRSFPGKR